MILETTSSYDDDNATKTMTTWKAQAMSISFKILSLQWMLIAVPNYINHWDLSLLCIVYNGRRVSCISWLTSCMSFERCAASAICWMEWKQTSSHCIICSDAQYVELRGLFFPSLLFIRRRAWRVYNIGIKTCAFMPGVGPKYADVKHSNNDFDNWQRTWQ